MIRVEQRRGTLRYLAPRADGDHAPERLLERCIDVKTAKTVGQMLQEDTEQMITGKRATRPTRGGVFSHRQDWDFGANCLFT